jgi:hypothetical protein
VNPARPIRAGLAAAPLALGLLACVNAYPQRVPPPLFLPEGAEVPEQPVPTSGTGVTVQRDSDPVWVRRPGERGDQALPFYNKRERVPLGTLVRTGAGGRAEVLWAPDATSLALFDECRVSLGDPARDEPTLRVHSVTRALLVLTPEDRIELMGGAQLAGDPAMLTGTMLLERAPGSILRVTNQSKLLVTIAFRTERLELGPGESIDLPVLSDGTEPWPEEDEPQRLELPGLSVAIHGRVEREDLEDGIRLTATEAARVRAFGVEARLEPGQTARFLGLSQVHPGAAADPIAQP